MSNTSPEGLVLPEVSLSTDENVVVEFDHEQATVLAKILAHYAALKLGDRPEGYVPEVWHHTLIQLLGRAAEVHVPFLHVVHTDDPADVEGLLNSLGGTR